MKRVYLDHIAATPLAPASWRPCCRFSGRASATPRASTPTARSAAEAVEEARAKASPALIGADAGRDHLHFQRLRGQQPRPSRAWPWRQRPREPHSSLSADRAPLRPERRQEPRTARASPSTLVPVDGDGRGRSGRRGRGARPRTRSSSRSCSANSEVGTIEPMAEIAAVCQSQGRPRPHRRGRRRRQYPGRCPGPGRRRPEPGRRPVRRPEGRRGPLPAGRGSSSCPAHRRRRPGRRAGGAGPRTSRPSSAWARPPSWPSPASPGWARASATAPRPSDRRAPGPRPTRPRQRRPDPPASVSRQLPASSSSRARPCSSAWT